MPSSNETHTPLLYVIVGSTRPGRAGGPVADWFFELASAHGGFAVELVDLAEVNLPLLDEPNHPRLRRYTKPHTMAWSERIERADAFVFVTPEYNHGPAPAILNAVDYLMAEWAHKPAGIVSYGGISAGTRSAEATKCVLTTVKLVVPPEAVHIPTVAQFIKDGRFVPNEVLETGARELLDELQRLERALRPLRGAPA